MPGAIWSEVGVDLIYSGTVSTGVGLVILAVIFGVGVVAFAILAITVLPGTILLESRVEELRRARRAVPPAAPSEDEAA